MVAGAFSFLPPFLPPPLGVAPPALALASACALASVTGPSPWACFLSFFSSSCFFLSSAIAVPLGLVELRAAALGDAHALSVLQHLGADPGRLLRLRVDQRQIGDVDAAVLLHDAAFGRPWIAPALLVALEHHPLLYHGTLLVLVDLHHLADLALLL